MDPDHHIHPRLTENPVWVLFDILVKAGYTEEYFDMETIRRAAERCEEMVEDDSRSTLP